MKSKLMMGVAALAFVAAATAAKADVSFNFTFTGPSLGSTITGSATGVATGANAPYLITSVTGTISNPNFGSRTITGVSTYLNADNQFVSLDQPFISNLGISFLTTGVNGSGSINVRFINNEYAIFSSEQQAITGDGRVGTATMGSVTFAPIGAAVPGPLAGAGLIPLLGFAGAWFARRRNQKLAA